MTTSITLHLDKDFNISNFPGGEVHISLKEGIVADIKIHNINTCILYAKLKNSNNIMSLLLAQDVLSRLNVKIEELIIPYFPYARQDRVCNKGEALSLKVMANIINNMNIPKVTIVDPHSDVTGALLNNVNIIERSAIFPLVVRDNYINIATNYHIICPDAGAMKATYKIAKMLNNENVYCCKKFRDTKTGNLTVDIDYLDWKNKKCIIIDDICDGGATFIEIAKKLKECGAKKVILYVTHGIFSKGLEVINEYIDEIYTTDSYAYIGLNNEYNFIKVLSLESVLDIAI